MKFRIQCFERVVYDQVVELTEEQWADLKATKQSRMEDGDASPLSSHLDMKEICGSRGFDDISIVEVDENGEPKEDGEEWES